MGKEHIVSTSFGEESPKDTLIISCNTVKRELESAIEKTGVKYPLTYLKSSLHDVPKTLNQAVQELIDEASDMGVKRILLGYATCGNSMAGLNTRSCQVILPRVDDCITFFLGSMERRRSLHGGIMFMTYGWLHDAGHGISYYHEIMEKYGEEMGEEVFEMMFENYDSVALIDTHCYDLEELKAECQEYADLIGKKMILLDGSNAYLEELMTGPWPRERFLIFDPGHVITERELDH